MEKKHGLGTIENKEILYFGEFKNDFINGFGLLRCESWSYQDSVTCKELTKFKLDTAEYDEDERIYLGSFRNNLISW